MPPIPNASLVMLAGAAALLALPAPGLAQEIVPPAPQAQAMVPTPGAGIVHLEADDRRAGLYRHSGSSDLAGGRYGGRLEHWDLACRPPCDAPLDRRFEYTVRGEGLASSPSFDLPGGALTVRAHMAGQWTRPAGLALTLFGTGFSLIGGLLFVMAQVVDTGPAAGDPTPPDTLQKNAAAQTAFRALGGVMLGAGLVSLGAGIALVVRKGTTVALTPQGLRF